MTGGKSGVYHLLPMCHVYVVERIECLESVCTANFLKSCVCARVLVYDYSVFFLLDRYAPAQRSARRSASVASKAGGRGGLTVDDGS